MDIAQYEQFVTKQKVAYISSIDADGTPCTRAMLAPRYREGIKVFYFTTNTSSHKVIHYRNNASACLYFCDPKNFRGLMLKGKIEILEDSESKKKIWRFGDIIYYHKGVTDPDYCVLKFTSTSGEYYESIHVEQIVL